jgi:hypothetical protein
VHRRYGFHANHGLLQPHASACVPRSSKRASHALEHCFKSFSSHEPVSTSLENAKPIKEAFPDARVIGASETVAAIKACVDKKLSVWGPQLKENGRRR